MALFDKLNKADLLDKVKKAGESAKEAIDKAKQAYDKNKEERELAKLPQEGGLKRYEVTYRGGHPDYPMDKAIKSYPNINMDIMPDRLSLIPKKLSEPWFKGVDIPYEKIISIDIVERTMSFTESMLGSNSDNSDLRQKNVLEITYLDDENNEYVMRNEMLTGTSVMGQARVCLEMMDLLRANKIPQKFIGKANQNPSQAQPVDVTEQLKKYKELLDLGVITQEEFDTKKKQLLDL